MNTTNEWRRVAEEHISVIERYQIDVPVKIGAIAKDLGIIVKSATLAAGISGEIKEVAGVVTIRVNRHDTKERQRFTLAHEVAHFLLHRDKIGDGIVDDMLYRSSLSDALEAEANRLAADIIMPREKVQQVMTKRDGSKVEEKIEFLANLLEVSTTAIKIRLGKL